ncbi:MAG: hypothetical protein ACSHXF_16990 [Aquaticitalea sp.]
MSLQSLLDNYRNALIALEPYFKNADIEPRGHDWSEEIVGSMFHGLVELPYYEKHGKRIHVTELCDYACPSDAIFIDFVIQQGSSYLKGVNGVFINEFAKTDIKVDILVDFSNFEIEDPFEKLNYVSGKSNCSNNVEFVAKYCDCKFT